MRLGVDVLRMDLYAILGVSKTASPAAIRAQYKRMVRSSHPDLNRTDVADAQKRTVDLNVAAWVLSDPTLRGQYDRARSRGGAAQMWYERKSSGPDEWVTPKKSSRPRPHGAELRQLLLKIRQWPGRRMLLFNEWTHSLSGRQRTTLTAFCFVTAALLISYAKPTSLTKLFEDDAGGHTASSIVE